MKKLLLAVMLLSPAVPVMAQDMLLGATMGYQYSNIVYRTSGVPGVADASWNNFNVSALMDIKYMRLTVGYTRNIGQMTEKSNIGGTSTTDTSKDLNWSFCSINTLFKIPFGPENGVVRIWPALGVGYDINLTAKDASGAVSDKALNDWYVLFGFGGDIFLAPKIGLTFSLLGGYNLTAKPNNNVPSGYKYSGIKGNVNVGVVFQMPDIL